MEKADGRVRFFVNGSEVCLNKLAQFMTRSYMHVLQIVYAKLSLCLRFYRRMVIL